ncbi:MAG: hypothetical protein IH948_04850, partial [Bacteroidetes bacterium]|nr:hypothetical protein [Bacteroidota bacterium]
NWVFGTGSAVTMPTGRFVYYNTIVPIYSERNGQRLPPYHRLDLSATREGKEFKLKKTVTKDQNGEKTITVKKKKKRNDSEWVFSVYNAYLRSNPYSIIFTQDASDPNTVKTEKVYLFSIIPAVTYNFKF